MTTAAASTPALSSSCPAPSKAPEIGSANRAMMPAPSPPRPTPSVTQAARSGTPRVAASTIPMISPASSTSRNTMTSAPSMPLLRDHDAFGGVRMELADELVAARLERADPDEALRFAGDDLLDLERGAVEFLRRRILVGHVDRHPLAGRNADFRRLELVVPDHEVELLSDGGHGRYAERRRERQDKSKSAHRIPRQRTYCVDIKDRNRNDAIAPDH